MILYRVRCPWGQKTLVTKCPWSFCTRYGAPENIWLQFLPKIFNLLCASIFQRPLLVKSPLMSYFAPLQYGQQCLLEVDCKPTRMSITFKSQTTPKSLSSVVRFKVPRSCVRLKYVSGTASTRATTNALLLPVLFNVSLLSVCSFLLALSPSPSNESESYIQFGISVKIKIWSKWL